MENKKEQWRARVGWGRVFLLTFAQNHFEAGALCWHSPKITLQFLFYSAYLTMENKKRTVACTGRVCVRLRCCVWGKGYFLSISTIFKKYFSLNLVNWQVHTYVCVEGGGGLFLYSFHHWVRGGGHISLTFAQIFAMLFFFLNVSSWRIYRFDCVRGEGLWWTLAPIIVHISKYSSLDGVAPLFNVVQIITTCVFSFDSALKFFSFAYS